MNGFAAQYEATGDKDALTAVQHFFDVVTHHHSYATGGDAPVPHAFSALSPFNPLDRLALSPFLPPAPFAPMPCCPQLLMPTCMPFVLPWTVIAAASQHRTQNRQFPN